MHIAETNRDLLGHFQYVLCTEAQTPFRPTTPKERKLQLLQKRKQSETNDLIIIFLHIFFAFHFFGVANFSSHGSRIHVSFDLSSLSNHTAAALAEIPAAVPNPAEGSHAEQPGAPLGEDLWQWVQDHDDNGLALRGEVRNI